MSTEKPIAGGDIKPGMTVILKPGGPLFPVDRVVEGPNDFDFSYVYEAGEKQPEIVWRNRWYVQVTS